MSLRNCPECNRQISELAWFCVGCGFSRQNQLQQIEENVRAIKGIMLIYLILSGVAGLVILLVTSKWIR